MTRSLHGSSFPIHIHDLAEWVRAGRCPPEALQEAGRLYVETRLAAVRAELGIDVRWAHPEDYSALDRIEVNADSIQCWWRPRLEGWDADTGADWSDMADWWNSMLLAERPIEKDFHDLPHPDRKNASSLDWLVNQWYATPEAERPKHFPLVPVVQAWIKSRDLDANAQPDGELSPEDYLPAIQRYQQEVRQAVEKDAKEMNGQNVHTAFGRVTAALEEHGEPRTEDKVNLLVGLLLATDCELHQDCPVEKPAAEGIKTSIALVGTWGDLELGRIERALDYAVGRGKYGKNLEQVYRKALRTASRRG